MSEHRVQEALASFLEWLRSTYGETEELALLSADADKIKDYVFESAKLPEIRGGSMILDELNWGEKPIVQGGIPRNISGVWQKHGLPERACIYAGGGSLLAVVLRHLVQELKEEIETLYPRETGTATISCVWQPITVDDLQNRLAGSMARQSLMLRRAKEEKELLPFFEAIPLSRRCESCGIRPASVHQATPDGRWLCWPCQRKVERSREHGGKKRWTRDFVDVLLAGQLDCDRETYLNGYMPAARELEPVSGANDLSEIAQASLDKKSIGFIYADGNHIGRLVEESKTVDEYACRSDVLHKAMRKAVFTALACHLKIQPDIQRKTARGATETVDIHPFEIITVGGDDALLIVPGDRALDVALALGRTFERKLAESPAFAGKRATVSVGLVVADHHNPVYFLCTLAEDLLKSAKKRDQELSATDRTSVEGTLDLLVLKSQTTLSTDLKDLRANFPWTITSPAPQREKAILTGRPYTWSQVERLKHSAQAVYRGLPHTQLQALRRALREGRLASTLFYLYQWARADQDRRLLLHWVEKEWGLQPADTPPPWIKLGPKAGYARYWTVWEDIHEAQDLVPRLKDEEWQELWAQIRREVESEVPHAG